MEIEGMKADVENCTRTRFTFAGENYYLVTGDTFVDVTCPRENSPDRINIQAAMDAICRVVTRQRCEAFEQRRRLEEDLALAVLAAECKT